MECSVPGCVNVDKTQLSIHRKFHTFPSDPVQCSQWVEAIRHPLFDANLTHNRRVCSDHFKNDDYEGGNKDVAALKPTAIPSVFPWSKTESESVSTIVSQQQIMPTMQVGAMPFLLTFQLNSGMMGVGPTTLAMPVFLMPGPSSTSLATLPAIDSAHKESVADSSSNRQIKTETQKLPLDSSVADQENGHIQVKMETQKLSLNSSADAQENRHIQVKMETQKLALNSTVSDSQENVPTQEKMESQRFSLNSSVSESQENGPTQVKTESQNLSQNSSISDCQENGSIQIKMENQNLPMKSSLQYAADSTSNTVRPTQDKTENQMLLLNSSLQSVTDSQSSGPTQEIMETQKLPLDSSLQSVADSQENGPAQEKPQDKQKHLNIMEDNDECLVSTVEDFSPPPSPNPAITAMQWKKAWSSKNSGSSKPSISAEIVVIINEDDGGSPDDKKRELGESFQTEDANESVEPEELKEREESEHSEETEESEESEKVESEGIIDSDDNYSPESDMFGSEDSDDHGDDDGHESQCRGLCQECGIVFNNLKGHMCEFKRKPHACNFCGKRFATEVCLKTHSRTHEDGFEQPCQFCHVKFRTTAERVAHEKTHSAEKPYQCPECPEAFPNVLVRNMHMKNHTVCRFCKMKFTRYHRLKRHMLVHTGVKPHVCDFCQRSFNQLSHLTSHMRLHTGEKPYKCTRCDKSFNHNVSLKSHTQRYHPQSEVDEGHMDTGIPMVIKKRKRPSSGRPKGRPKRNVVDCTYSTVSYGGGDSVRVKKENNSASDFDPSEIKKQNKVRGECKRRGRGRPSKDRQIFSK